MHGRDIFTLYCSVNKEEGKIRNQYNQITFLTQGTVWESDTYTEGL